MRAAIYARVSTKKQDDAIQLDELEEYVKRWGWEPALYGDKESGKAGVERPGLERLLKDARLKKIDIVLVYKLDRFGRSLRDVLNNIGIPDRASVRFIARRTRPARQPFIAFWHATVGIPRAAKIWPSGAPADLRPVESSRAARCRQVGTANRRTAGHWPGHDRALAEGVIYLSQKVPRLAPSACCSQRGVLTGLDLPRIYSFWVTPLPIIPNGCKGSARVHG